jgi:Flp pilus assembly protein TadD
MPRIEKTVFISYRRQNLPWALFIWQNLTMHGYDVFFDYQSIDSGNFEKVILENIRARAHFIIILTPSALEKCKNPDDWLRREIETAMDEKRNIVPLMLEGFDFGSPSVKEALTGKLAQLNTYNGLPVPDAYALEAMDRLRERYLNIALSDIVLPIMKVEAREITETQIEAANEAPPVKGEQLTAQTWFERGIIFQNGNNVDEALRCYTEAIRLDPNLDAAHNNLAILLDSLKRYDEAEIAYRKAIAIDPNSAQPYSNLGVLLEELERYAEAEEAHQQAIAKDPNLAQAYINLAIMLRQIGRNQDATLILKKLITVAPQDFIAYLEIASIQKHLGKLPNEEYLLHARTLIAVDDWYSLACLESVSGNIDDAFKNLSQAAQKAGFDKEQAWKEPDFEWIQNDPRFIETVGPPPKKE